MARTDPPSRRLAALTFAALAASWACAGNQRSEPLDPTAPVGCYQFAWNSEAARLGLPWGLVLMDEPLSEGWPIHARGDVRSAATATSPSGRADHPFGYWLRTAGDSIEVGYPGGGGIVLVLSPEGPDLVGEGRAVGDAARPLVPNRARPSLGVAARRVTCGATSDGPETG